MSTSLSDTLSALQNVETQDQSNQVVHPPLDWIQHAQPDEITSLFEGIAQLAAQEQLNGLMLGQVLRAVGRSRQLDFSQDQLEVADCLD